MGITNFLYNPERKGKQQLIDEFVIRQDIFHLIMDDLNTSPMKTPEQHYLLVGQRGTGKTTLLHRVRYAIEDEPKLRDLIIPVILSEEQYNISELANLWENVGQVLEDYHGFDGLYTEMEKNISALDFDERCWEVLEAALEEKGKKIVLLIDNIGDLLKKLSDKEIRRLRMLLQTKPQIRMIAASPLFLESILDYKQPFFEFFKVLLLDGLNNHQTHALLLKLADIHGEKDKIEKIIWDTPQRIETLRTLTGGVPRTIALVFNIFVEHEQESSLKDLEKILDVVTPLYKHRMDDLPTQQQRIVDAVAKAWDPIGVKQLKERVRLEGKIISAQLRQLEKNQVVQKLETSTKNHEYLLKERFFNIWYLMRYGRKDDKQRVIWLVRFLESWCTDKELEDRIARFVERLRGKDVEEASVNFLGEVYASLSRLTLKSKLLLHESAPSRYGKALNFSDKEITRVIDESMAEGSYQKSMRWLFMLRQLDYKHLLTFVDVIEKLASEGRSVMKNMLDFFSDRDDETEVTEVQLTLVASYQIALSAAKIRLSISKGEFELISKAFLDQLMFVGLLMTDFSYGERFWNRSLEMTILLGTIRTIYLAGQYSILRKVFEEHQLPGKNRDIPFSEIFNPIYLALNSLDPDRTTLNLAPEKEELVNSIKEVIVKKE